MKLFDPTATIQTVVHIWAIGALFALVAACRTGDADTTTKDIATDIPGEDQQTTLYFISGDDIVRSKCVQDLPPSRATCTEELSRRDFVQVKQELSDGKLERRRQLDADLETTSEKRNAIEDQLATILNEKNQASRDLEEKAANNGIRTVSYPVRMMKLPVRRRALKS